MTRGSGDGNDTCDEGLMYIDNSCSNEEDPPGGDGDGNGSGGAGRPGAQT